MSDLNQLNDFIKHSVNDFMDKKEIRGDHYENRQDLIDNLECEIDRDLTPDVLNAIKYKVIMEILEFLNENYSFDEMENENIINPVKTYAMVYAVDYYEDEYEKDDIVEVKGELKEKLGILYNQIIQQTKKEDEEEQNKKNFIALLTETGFKLI